MSKFKSILTAAKDSAGQTSAEIAVPEVEEEAKEVETEVKVEPEASEVKILMPAQEETQPKSEPIEHTEPSQPINSQLTAIEELTPNLASEPRQSKKMGRPKIGKRSDPDYEQVTAYIKSATYTDVKIELLEEGKKGPKREFSELLQELLEEWLQGRN